MTTRITPDLINGNVSLRNRLVNGSMAVNQRNATSFSIPSATGTYIRDNWIAGSALSGGAITISNNTAIPSGTGFTNSILCETTTTRTLTSTEYATIQTGIEGSRMVDFNFGTASAKTIAISFWVYASVTGTYSGSVMNGGSSRAYPFSYTVNNTFTWEQKTIVVTGDTTGTWNINTSLGMRISFLLAGGSSFLNTANAWVGSIEYGATGSSGIMDAVGRQIAFTGVQVEIGQAASAFDFKGYAQDLADCQRYYFRHSVSGTSQSLNVPLSANSTTVATGDVRFPVQMRVSPTALEQTGTASNYSVIFGGTQTSCSAVPSFAQANLYGARTSFTVASGLTAAQSGSLHSSSVGSTTYLGWSAEML